ncbi:hypothetical protein BH20ACT9_BH20ACT9_16400 [soil metagenome]
MSPGRVSGRPSSMSASTARNSSRYPGLSMAISKSPLVAYHFVEVVRLPR